MGKMIRHSILTHEVHDENEYINSNIISLSMIVAIQTIIKT